MRKVKTLDKIPYQGPDSETFVVPSPTDGWDAISPLSAMDPKRAPILDNFVPRTGWVELRLGYIPQVQALSSLPVETLLVYRSPTGEKLFAATNNKIFDVSTAFAPVQVLTGLSSNRWQYVNFAPSGAATVMQMVNGQDSMQQWNGTVWSVPAITGLPSGVTTSTFTNIFASKRRLWYIVGTTNYAIFMPTDAITGPIAGFIDLGALFTKGGHIVQGFEWTIDGGTGPQAYTGFISSRGQVAIYAGADPTGAWGLVGTFAISPPISLRCATQIGSDVGLITQQGVLPISQVLPFDPSADRSVAITARIQNAMLKAAQIGKSMFGWQLLTFPAQALLILNVPEVESTQQVQYVSNMLTGAWCRFTGWNANCFEIFNDNLYWGDNSGNVNQGYTSGMDFITSIQADMQCAFNYFETPGRTKRMTMIQPLLVTSGQIVPFLDVDQDFGTSTDAAPLITIGGTTLWDVAQWDVDLWPVETTVQTDWYSADALGHALAVRMKTNIGTPDTGSFGVFDVAQFDIAQFDSISVPNPTLQINAFNVLLEEGGTI